MRMDNTYRRDKNVGCSNIQNRVINNKYLRVIANNEGIK